MTPEQAVDRLNYESWKPSHLALPVPERCLGAFAGGFEEVDENVEYEERRDEFNIAKVLAMHGLRTLFVLVLHCSPFLGPGE